MEFSIQKDPVCSRCGEPLGFPDASVSPLTCRVCRLAPPAFVRAVSYGPYEGRMRDAIHALKYGGLHPAARRLGEMLAAAVGGLAPPGPGRNAGHSGAAASVEACAKGLQPGTPSGGECTGWVRQNASGLEAYARPERGCADSRHREPGQSHAASKADQSARSLCGPRSDGRSDETHPAHRRHFHHRGHSAFGGTVIDAVGRRKRLGGHPGTGLAGFRSAGRRALGP